MSETSFCLQPLFVPEMMGKKAPLLYFRGEYSLKDVAGNVRISTTSTLNSDTYFNAFPLDKWHSKTALHTLRFSLTIETGAGVLTVTHRTPHSTNELYKSNVDATAKNVYTVDISLAELRTGIVFWSLTTDTSITISDAKYETTMTPLRDVRVGVVITAYHRDEDVIDAIKRFNSSRLPSAGHVLFVIDNGRTLAGEQIFANRNLGASGGFTRGILEIRRHHNLTHALFMDDDAPAHMSCIEKAVAFLRFASTDNIAIAGSMLTAEAPNIQYNAGLKFHVTTAAFLKADRDMTDIVNLLSNEEDEPIDVGAFYFFAVPVHHITHLPFPYFVRGDDVLFSLQNRFDVVTVTGIACWQSSFDEKTSPSMAYLTYRARLLTGCLMAVQAQYNIFDVFDEIMRAVRLNAELFRYGDANAILDAVEDILKGPSFFESNPSAIERLAEISSKYLEYYPREIDGKRIEIFANEGERPTVIVGLGPRFDSNLYGRNKVIFLSRHSNIGLMVAMSDDEHSKIITRVNEAHRRFRSFGERCVVSFGERLPYIQSEEFWRNALQLERAKN